MKNAAFIILITALLFAGCRKIGMFERSVAIPDHEWNSSFKPQVQLEVTDTVSTFNLYVVIRHTDAYRYNNIWLNIYTKVPGGEENKQRLDLRLATDDKGWLGSGMDDIFEHRIFISSVKFPRTGVYTFRFENLMREDPLQHVMNIGLRVEKVP